MNRELITIEQFLRQHQPPAATGDLTALLHAVALGGKIIAGRVRRAGLAGILGESGTTNVQGETQKLLDVYADRILTRLLTRGGRVRALVSEEREDWMRTPDADPPAPYVVAFDPLDGSSNIDSNVSIGTIFGIFRALDDHGPATIDDCLRPGRDLVAAGYLLYGTATLLVYSAGDGVHAFTLDPELGEFLLTDPQMRYPEQPTYYSFNLASSGHWDPHLEEFLAWLDHDSSPALTQRYIGSAVADFHRNLIHGGIFGYPGDDQQPRGKLRLLYEAAPLAYLSEQAGGAASDGTARLLDIVPETLHQRTPVFLGTDELVEAVRAGGRR